MSATGSLGGPRGVARLLRTVRRLHPLQVAARPMHVAFARLGRAGVSRLGGVKGPTPVETWPSPPAPLVALANAERARAEDRLQHLPIGSRLRAYEETYGLELGADGLGRRDRWQRPEALEPYPASVRARRIAVAMRCGGTDLARSLAPELTRAARAVMVQPELHLLGNHLLENGFALACAGAVTRGPEADAWWQLGSWLLSWQLPEQFLSDGGHFERTASYHLAVTAALLETIELADASGRRALSAWRGIASRALAWARVVRAPDGTYPLFNDASLDAAPTVDTVLALGDALVPPAPLPGQRFGAEDLWAVVLEPTGWVIAACGAHGEGAAWLALDAGPEGPRYQPGHAHADALTLELWIDGVRALVDYGVASYAWDAAREKTRATRSHNTVELAGIDSCETWGAFRVGRGQSAWISSVSVDGGTLCIRAQHDGYAWRPGRPIHVRELRLRQRQLEVVDRVTGGQERVTSRLRLDAALATRVHVRAGGGEAVVRPDVWYPHHARAREALVYTQHGQAQDLLQWCIEW